MVTVTCCFGMSSILFHFPFGFYLVFHYVIKAYKGSHYEPLLAKGERGLFVEQIIEEIPAKPPIRMSIKINERTRRDLAWLTKHGYYSQALETFSMIVNELVGYYQKTPVNLIRVKAEAVRNRLDEEELRRWVWSKTVFRMIEQVER